MGANGQHAGARLHREIDLTPVHVGREPFDRDAEFRGRGRRGAQEFREPLRHIPSDRDEYRLSGNRQAQISPMQRVGHIV